MRSDPRRWLRIGVAVALCCVSTTALAVDDWIHHQGAGEQAWGTTERPDRISRMPKKLNLPDVGFAGRTAADKPDDWEIAGPHEHGERHFLRYVDGALVDAWILRPGPIDGTQFQMLGPEQWRGAVLGMNNDGWREIGDAVSWDVGGRTVMLWRSRASSHELLASRAVPGGRYSAQRPKVLVPSERLATGKANISGDLKKQVKPASTALEACLNDVEKPIRANVFLGYDKLGRLARLKVDGDRAIYEAEVCIAAALVKLPAAPMSEGSFEIYRFR